jgi:type I restriction enzyme S subunit
VTESYLPHGWTVSELDFLRAKGEHTFVGGPFGSDLTQKDYVPEPGVPVIRGTNLGGNESRFIDDGFVYVSADKAESLRRNTAFRGDLVFTQRGTLGQVAIIPNCARFDRYVISQSQMKLTPDPSKIDCNFLYHYFRTPRALAQLLRQTQATGVPHINLGILKRFPVVVPPLPEQQRIAEVMDRAAALRAKRRAALAQLDTLTQSIFLDMFGDPVSNPKRLPWRRLKQCTHGVQIGPFGSLLHRGDYVSGGVPLINPTNIQDGAIVPDYDQSVAVSKHAALALYQLRQGDVIMGRRGEMGRCAIVGPEHDGFVCGTGSLFIRPDVDNATALYLATVLSSSAIRRKLERASLGATLPNLNRGIVENLQVPVPVIVRQRDFANRVDAIDRLRSVQAAALAESDVLFASLQHRAFRGEL